MSQRKKWRKEISPHDIDQVLEDLCKTQAAWQSRCVDLCVHPASDHYKSLTNMILTIRQTVIDLGGKPNASETQTGKPPIWR